MGITTLDILGVAIGLLVVTYTYLKWSFQYWKRKNVPYLEPTLILGNFDFPLTAKKSLGDEVTDLYRICRQKGWKYAGVYMFMLPMFMPIDLNLLKHIMTKDFNHFIDRGLFVNEEDEPINAHLFSLGGKKWTNLRKKFTPTFTSSKMRMMFQTLADCGVVLEKYVDEIISKNSKEPIDIKNVLGCYSTDIIGSCAFGLECNSFKEPDNNFRKYGNRVFEFNLIDMIKNAITESFPNLSKKLHITLVPKDASQFFTNIVKDTVAYREKNRVERKDFLQLLIDIKNNKEAAGNGQKDDGTTLTMDEIVGQSFVFFIAGFETSSTTMTFALYSLSRNQELQDKVREEIHRVLKKHDNQITYDSLKDLVFMEQVINETLRMYPPLPFITRECVEDYKVPDSDVVIKKGTRVIISINGLHYDEEYYPNPEVFDPERFNAENVRNRHQYAHIPFGEGPRICIGMRFGIMQTKIGLVSILRNHRVTLNPKTKLPLKMAIDTSVSSTEGDMWLNIEKI